MPFNGCSAARRLTSVRLLRSFWKYVKKLDRREARRYLEMFYILRLRPLIAQARTCAPSTPPGQAQKLTTSSAGRPMHHMTYARGQCMVLPRRILDVAALV